LCPKKNFSQEELKIVPKEKSLIKKYKFSQKELKVVLKK
jgi:hypothetical protein